MSDTVNCFLQARMSSSRLPGKVLKDIMGQPMLSYMIERLKQAASINQIVILTSVEPSDDPIEDFCKENNIFCFRGSLKNVLDRYYQASKTYPADHYIRVTGDCPLIDPDVIDEVVNLHLKGQYDYTSNIFPRSFPDGLDAEIVTSATLEKIWNNADTDYCKEHVTIYVSQHSEEFSRGNYQHETNYPDIRITVDYPEDFILIKAIFENLYPNNKSFKLSDIVNFVRKNSQLLINHKYSRATKEALT